MKFITVALITMFSLSTMVISAQDLNTPDKKDIYNIILLIGKAWTQNNLDTLNKYIDANYIHIDVRGQKLNRTQWLEYVKDRKEHNLTNPDIEFEDIQIAAYKDLSIVTGINTFTGNAYTTNEAATGKPRKIRFTQVLQKQGGIWKRMNFQATYIDNP